MEALRRNFRLAAVVFAAVVLVALCGQVMADEQRDAVSDDFAKTVAPILVKHCSDCHSNDDAELDLDLTSQNSVLSGSSTGAVIVPGKAASSLLVQVLAKAAKPHMPPEGQLPKSEIEAIAKWVDQLPQNTPVGKSQLTDRDRSHWSFQPVVRPTIPIVHNQAWAITPVDHFILAKLESHNLGPNPPASKATLLRRVYFDLIGLPPSPTDVDDFLADDSVNAYEQVVDRLLASPQYGERWGRHWLDLARYADSGGFHNDIDRPNAWRYRDYVINSLNADKPYADFIREQIAGDQLPDASLDTWIATGFSCNGPSNDDNMGKTETARLQYRMDELDDIVSTTANVFLGLTIGCARCHDHKFDPISQRDYYSFLAHFNVAHRRELDLNGFNTSAPKVMGVPKKPNKKPAALVLTSFGQKTKPTHLFWRGNVRNRGPVMSPTVPAVLSDQSTADDNRNRVDLANWIASPGNPMTWRVMANRLWHYHFGRGLVTTPSNFGRLGTKPTHPELLDFMADRLRREGGQLKDLHQVIVTSAVYRQSSQANAAGTAGDPGNQLWWRMEKRRLESEALRDAILVSSGNINLAAGGPGIKPRIRPELLVASQRNKWPTVKQEGPQHWRRSVYVYVKRQLQLPMLELFNSPSTNHSCARRESSMVPTQALVLMNDSFVRDQARAMAQRVQREAGSDPSNQVRRALLIALSRTPSEARVAEATQFLEAQTQRLIGEGQTSEDADVEALADFCHVLINLSEFAYLD